MVGLFEEVWFRGIWFAAFDGTVIGGVIAGSVVFGLVHYSPVLAGRGVDTFIGAALVGFVYGSARFAGAGILPLRIAHGVFDFFFLCVWREKKQRFAGIATIIVGIGGLLALGGAFVLPAL